jgi:hypothetical protein
MVCKKIQKCIYVKYVLCKLSLKNHAPIFFYKKSIYLKKSTDKKIQIQTIKTQTQKANK